MAEDPTNVILAPFDEATQFRLKLMDAGCEQIVTQEEEVKKQAELSGVKYEVSMETAALLEFSKCFGILMNRAIDCGWIDDIHKGEVNVN